MLALQVAALLVFIVGGHGAGTLGIMLLFLNDFLKSDIPLVPTLVVLFAGVQVVIPVSIVINRPVARLLAIALSAIATFGLAIRFATVYPEYAMAPIGSSVPYLAICAWNLYAEIKCRKLSR